MNIIKNFTPIVLLLMASTTFLNAQLYVSGGLGYGISATPEPFGLIYDFEKDSADDKIFTKKNVTNGYGNAGRGLRVNTGLGYMLTENFGVELGVYYFTSPEIFVQDTINVDGFYTTYTKAWHLRLTPSLVFMAGNGKVKPYAKVGLCVPVAGLAKARREANDPLLVNEQFAILNYSNDAGELITADRFDLEAEFKGQFSLGFESVAGVNYNISDKLSVFGEVSFTMLRIRRATSEVKKGIATMSNGDEHNILPLLSIGGVYEYTEFVDEIDVLEIDKAKNNAPIREDIILPSGQPFPVQLFPITNYGSTAEKAHQLLASDGAYNAIGLNIGVRFNF